LLLPLSLISLLPPVLAVQVAELVTAVLNTNSHTFAVSPVFNVLERAVIKGMAERIGFATETCDGLLGPGGTFNNVTALMLARHACFPHVRLSGWQSDDNAVCFTSAQAHYSIKRGAMLAGIGMDACVAVAASMEGSMSASALDEEITRCRANGKTPFFVSCTAGTTVLGGFDEFTAIRAVIDKHNATLEAPKKIWMHVDGAWGGSLAMSDRPELRALISGVELADSVLWNFHKGMGLPIFASALLTNNRPRALEASNQSCAECALPPASTVHQSWICLGNEMLLMCLHLV
jgi:glutamate/tyrosine decarboxylase-like PLP-dependent enzyme